ncbi:hypothetical protein BDR06DRAFT_1060685 [Suillus hirtellus]|nr:hypothetical protein BDR06DRAFT_1060685 [Suillus hirtellus]
MCLDWHLCDIICHSWSHQQHDLKHHAWHQQYRRLLGGHLQASDGRFSASI